jgi:hypothetical protein
VGGFRNYFLNKKGGSMNVLTKYYTKDTDVVSRNVVAETIIVAIKNRMGDLNSIFTLSEVGLAIWEMGMERGL